MSARTIKSFLAKTVGIVTALLYVSPVAIIFINAVKPLGDTLRDPFALPTSLYMGNIEYVWKRINYLRILGNTVLAVIMVVCVTVTISAMCGYKLSRTNDKKSKFILAFLMASMMIPFQSIMLPVYRMASVLGMSNSLWGYIAILVPLYAPFAVFVYHGAVKNIPRVLEESAVIDGCPPVRLFFRIIFPLLVPVTASIVVLFTLWVWNDFLLPNILLRNPEIKTLTTSIFTFFSSYNTRWDYILASLALSMFPITIFFIFMQRYFISGMVAGAVKG